ncbi:MAG: MBG domain-containing protein, partial [Flavobacterium sp.]|nr:MBG domain-containing protein [Flavobacterium sp.]
MKTFLLKSHFLTIVFLAANLFFTSVAFGQATVTTDKDDYAPGEYVIITGTGWTPGETVTLHFDETPKPATCLLPHDMTAVADASGNIYNNQFLIKINHIGVAFLLTATGQTSGLVATRNFTDANIQFTLTGLPNSSSSTVTIVYWTVANGQAQSVQTTTTETISVAANGNAATISVPAQPNTQLSWTFNNVTIGNNTYISSGSTSGLNSITSPITVNGNLTGNNAIKGNYASCTSPSAPTISSPVIYCLGTTPTALTATGSNLLWYSGATGGIGSSIAPTPSTNSSGTTSYYVSQTIGCESSRAKIDVTVNALPVAPNAGNYSGAYDGLPHVGSAVAGAGETIDWYTTLLGGNPTSAPSGTNVGVYSAYAEARNTTTGCVSTTRTLVSVTITKKAASVSPIANTKVYGSPEPVLTGTLVGFLEADAVTASYSRTSGETVLGTYSISAVLNPTGILSNYDITYNTAAFTITTKAASVSPIANTKVYGSPEPVLTGTLVGFLEADAVTASYSRTAGETVLGGPYTISAVLNPTGVLSNYDITYNTASFTISKKTASVTPYGSSKYCGQNDPLLFTGNLAGFIGNDNVTAVYNRIAGEIAGGIYTISALLSPSSVLTNYNIDYNTALFTINSVLIDASASSAPIALGSSATLSATVTSAVSGNLSGIPVLFTIDNGNGVITSYVSQTNSSGLATFSVSNLSVEVYKIKAAAGSGCANATAYLAVYDPNGGFVTGGGWIMSPLGAYTANPTLTGKANFGFNAKYKKGNTQVDGNTEFQFQTGNLNFSSSSHEAMSLVIAGAQAIYKGQGTINGVPGYSFMVSAIDGEKKSTGITDKFRIKIWNGAGVVYDNQIGAADNADATTAIGGGSIVIHEVKKNGAAKVVIVEKTPEIVPFAITAYPNPSAQYFIIDIKGGTSEKTEVIVYDILGRMVKHIQNSDSKEIKFGEELSSGSYIAIINQGT